MVRNLIAFAIALMQFSIQQLNLTDILHAARDVLNFSICCARRQKMASG